MNPLLLLSLSVTVLAGCSSVRNHRDISDLEKPPVLQIVKHASSIDSDDESQQPLQRKALGGLVTIDGDEQHPRLKIKGSFDRAWELLYRTLTIGKIEIADKNRDDGVFRVTYDPDIGRTGEGALDSLKNLFNNALPEADYDLKLETKGSYVFVKAEQVDKDKNTDQARDDDINKGEANLIFRLQTIMREEFLK